MKLRSLQGGVLLAALVFAAGCGSGSGKNKAEQDASKLPGAKVFASAGCAGCHTLKAANATGTVGPNLDEKKPPLSLIVDRVTNGKSPMPAFGGTLSPKQIADVAAFVYQSTHS